MVALTVHEDASYLLQLCKAGAVGYVLKRSAGDDLIHAIRDRGDGRGTLRPGPGEQGADGRGLETRPARPGCARKTSVSGKRKC